MGRGIQVIPFSLDTNGTLKTAVVFDYENNASTYSIRARASDILGASVEGNFTITLLDLDDTAPIITLNGDSNITHEAGAYTDANAIDANASWSDAVDGFGVIVASGEVNASYPGTYVLSFNYTDAAGNVCPDSYPNRSCDGHNRTNNQLIWG